MSISPRHATAITYALGGIPVFPCLPGAKEPATPHGFLGRTTDLRIIERWWAYNDYNLAIVPADAGWVVIDIDPKNGGDETWALLSASAELVPTKVVLTPSGGRHLYFVGAPRPSNNGRIGRGIDVRCQNGYVLVPPSVIGEAQYEVIDVY